jgi:hypothetical protein
MERDPNSCAISARVSRVLNMNNYIIFCALLAALQGKATVLAVREKQGPMSMAFH